MKQQTRQVVSHRVPSEYFVNQLPRQPGQRLITHHVAGPEKHPAQRLGGDALEVRIGVDLDVVIPKNEAGLKSAPKRATDSREKHQADEGFGRRAARGCCHLQDILSPNKRRVKSEDRTASIVSGM